MKAVCWNGTKDMRIENVPDPKILNPQDAIVKITLTAICGSDLHMYDGYIPTMKAGDIIGHEFMGEIVEVGSEVDNLHVGDKVVIPFPIACGRCWFCQHEMWSLCDNSNPNAALVEPIYGYSPAGIFGYSHAFGGYAGGQAEYARVPYANIGAFQVPKELDDEKLLFLTDIFPTGYMAAENCNIQPGDTVAVWGCGPVGQFAIRSAYMLGAERVIAIDHVPERLCLAETHGHAKTINFEETKVVEALRDMTGNRGPDACIDAVGMEATDTGLEKWYDRIKQSVRLETGRPHALREAIVACRKGGIISIPGVYGGFIDSVPMGAAFNKGLTFKMGQTHVHKYLRPLLDRIQRGEIDPSFIITHRFPLDDAPHAYELFAKKLDNCLKAVLYPWGVPADKQRSTTAEREMSKAVAM